ncbi:hypothetical protein HUA78_42560 [Myxococcus sp. CA033]|nr:hypothetical protein [Myxococcus sp. CA033]NTX41132.1 hypothetical protein [Myxococcus sp. CA033]
MRPSVKRRTESSTCVCPFTSSCGNTSPWPPRAHLRAELDTLMRVKWPR